MLYKFLRFPTVARSIQSFATAGLLFSCMSLPVQAARPWTKVPGSYHLYTHSDPDGKLLEIGMKIIKQTERKRIKFPVKVKVFFTVNKYRTLSDGEQARSRSERTKKKSRRYLNDFIKILKRRELCYNSSDSDNLSFPTDHHQVTLTLRPSSTLKRYLISLILYLHRNFEAIDPLPIQEDMFNRLGQLFNLAADENQIHNTPNPDWNSSLGFPAGFNFRDESSTLSRQDQIESTAVDALNDHFMRSVEDHTRQINTAPTELSTSQYKPLDHSIKTEGLTCLICSDDFDANRFVSTNCSVPICKTCLAKAYSDQKRCPFCATPCLAESLPKLEPKQSSPTLKDDQLSP